MKVTIARSGNDTRATPDAVGILWRILNATLRATHLRFGRAARAHDRRRASETIGAETMRDTGVTPETATGNQSWQADLPFFMQSRFHRR